MGFSRIIYIPVRLIYACSGINESPGLLVRASALQILLQNPDLLYCIVSVLKEPVEVGQVGGGDVLVYLTAVHRGQDAGGLYAVLPGTDIFQIQCLCLRS